MADNGTGPRCRDVCVHGESWRVSEPRSARFSSPAIHSCQVSLARLFCRQRPTHSYSQDFAKLIQSGRVHRTLYTDPASSKLKWIASSDVPGSYVGHESQVKKPGDYFTTQIGRRPVVMVRDETGAIGVIHNQCAHRGAMVVATAQGSAPRPNSRY